MEISLHFPLIMAKSWHYYGNVVVLKRQRLKQGIVQGNVLTTTHAE